MRVSRCSRRDRRIVSLRVEPERQISRGRGFECDRPVTGDLHLVALMFEEIANGIAKVEVVLNEEKFAMHGQLSGLKASGRRKSFKTLAEAEKAKNFVGIHLESLIPSCCS